jgi:4a-hydroxytetrahydrobiopterin dehydratase
MRRDNSVSLLSERTIKTKLRSVKGWKRRGTTIVRIVRAKDFVRAMGFVQSVALMAEKADHHPDIDIRWNTVTLVLSTHSEGGLTEKDFALAVLINSLA